MIKAGLSYAQNVFSCVFVAIICIPIVLTLFNKGPNPISISENRQLIDKLNLSTTPLLDYPSTLDTYFKDRLAFRSQLIYAYTRLWAMKLKAPTMRYISGRDDELFIHKVGPTVFPYLGVTPLSKEHLILVKLSYNGMQAFWSLYDVPYLLVMLPDKPTLYPEKLPFWAFWKRGTSWLAQIRETLADTPVNVLDLTEPLLEQRTLERVYNTNFDTEHLNGNALKLSYHAIGTRLSALFPDFLPHPEGTCYTIRNIDVSSIENSGYGRNDTVPFLETASPEQLKDISDTLPVRFGKDWWQLKASHKEGKAHTLWFATDSSFLATHSSSRFVPLAHHVSTMLHMHYADFTFENAKKLLPVHRPDVVVEAFLERMGGNVGRAAQDPLIRILGDAVLRTPAVVLPLARTVPLEASQATLSYRGDVLELETDSHDPMLFLPPLTTDKDGRGVLMARVEVPADTMAQLFVANKGEAFTEAKSVSVSLHKGINLVHMQF